MNTVKFIIFTATVTFFLSNAAFAQQSDYQVQQSFLKQADSLRHQITYLDSSNEADSVLNAVETFRENFAKFEELLDDVLFPQSFNKITDDIYEQARAAHHKFLILENQEEELSKLSGQIALLSSRFNALNTTADSLKKEIKESENSEARLSRLLAEYRKSIEQRDAVIFDMADSLLFVYKRFYTTDSNEAEAVQQQKLATTGRDLLRAIHQASEENVAILSRDHQFTTEEYLRMYAAQYKFQEMWDKIGGDLSGLYESEELYKQKIDKSIHRWKDTVKSRAWSAIYTDLKKHQVEVDSFYDQQTFFKALNGYLESSGTKGTGLSNEKLSVFREFWDDKIKEDWGSYVTESDMLTLSQISAIDKKLHSGSDDIEEQSYLLPVLLGFCLLVIAGLIIALFFKP